MSHLKHRLSMLIPGWREERERLIAEHGGQVISTVSIAQAAGGLRGVACVPCDTSEVHPTRGLLIRGIPISELAGRLPEEIFWLLCTGELPDPSELRDLQAHICQRQMLPRTVWEVLKRFPEGSHPMSMFIAAIQVLQTESDFIPRLYGLPEERYWEAMVDDALKLLAALPIIAGVIYRLRYGLPERVLPDPGLDWAAGYAQLLDLPETSEARAMLRRYLVVHSDHESGNVSAFASHTVGSMLGDPFAAVSAAMCGLAGPRHGLASQNFLRFVHTLRERYGPAPTRAEIEAACWQRLNTGRIIPGFGHAVLRGVDPRFDVLHEFARQHCQASELLSVAETLYEVAPRVLTEQGKAASTYMNVDAITGVLLHHFGITEPEYYTVVFGVGLSVGLMAQLVVHRALQGKMLRFRSATTAQLRALAGP